MSPNTTSIHRKFVIVGLIVMCSLLLTAQFTYAQGPFQGEGPGSGLTPGEVQGGTVEGAPSGGANTQDNPSYNGCVFVWDVWPEDNSGMNWIFEPGDDIYFYMQVDNDCYPFVAHNTLFWWEVWSPGSVSQISYQEYFMVYTGTGKWSLHATFPADPPMGEWLYKGTTAYTGGTNFDTDTFEVRPKAPTGVNASDDTYTDKVRVTWSASSGATSYDVYRATSSGGTYSFIGEPTGTSFDDTTATPGTTYYYKVRGCVSVGCGGYSIYDSGRRATGPVSDEDTVGFYDPATKIWRMKEENTWSGSVNYLVWGPNGGGWTPVTGDWDNDVIDEVGFYDPATKIWRMKTENTWSGSVNYLVWGPNGGGWTPVTGDWDNDGVDEVGFYDPATKIWRMKTENTWSGSVNYLVWGPNGGGWTPVTGDWDNDGIDEVGFYDPATKIWRMKTENTWSGSVNYLVWGPNGGGWTPVTGDWDNDGVDEVGFYDPATKIWRMKTENTWSGSVNYLVWGPNGGGWTPVTGDW